MNGDADVEELDKRKLYSYRGAALNLLPKGCVASVGGPAAEIASVPVDALCRPAAAPGHVRPTDVGRLVPDGFVGAGGGA